MKQPMIDVAYDVLKTHNKPLVFIDLFNNVSEIKGLTQVQQENEIAQFFTDLTLDDRYVNMGENIWDLKERHKLDEVKKAHIDDFVDEEEEDIIEEEDD